MNHFRVIAHVDTFELTASLRDRIKEFDAMTLRQDYPGSAHRDTRSIFLRGPAMNDEWPADQKIRTWFADVPHVDYPIASDWPEVWPFMRAVADSVFAYRPGAGTPVLGKVMVIELKPGGSLAWHVDQGPYSQATTRFHLPLVTNPQAWMYSGGEQAHLPVGALTWFDTSVPHSAVNLGAEPRYHLVVDVRR